jgi:hypothetical protein
MIGEKSVGAARSQARGNEWKHGRGVPRDVRRMDRSSHPFDDTRDTYLGCIPMSRRGCIHAVDASFQEL